jgi:hypothetical protein
MAEESLAVLLACRVVKNDCTELVIGLPGCGRRVTPDEGKGLRARRENAERIGDA